MAHITSIMRKESVVAAPQGQPVLPPVGATPGQAIPPMDPAMMGGAPPLPEEGTPPGGGDDITAEIEDIKITLQSLIDGQTAMLEVLTSMMQPEGGSAPGLSSSPPSPEKLSNLLETGLTPDVKPTDDDDDDLNTINRIQGVLRG